MKRYMMCNVKWKLQSHAAKLWSIPLFTHFPQTPGINSRSSHPEWLRSPHGSWQFVARDWMDQSSSSWWYTYPCEKYEWKSVGMMNSQLNGKIKFMFQTTNQIIYVEIEPGFFWRNLGKIIYISLPLPHHPWRELGRRLSWISCFFLDQTAKFGSLGSHES